MATDPVDEFRNALLDWIGRHLPDAIAPASIEPGKIERFTTNGKRSDTAGYCKLFPDLRGGFWGDHRTGQSGRWQASRPSEPTPADKQRQVIDLRAKREEREKHQRASWEENGQRNAQLWRQCLALQPGDPVTRYLTGRELAHPKHPFPDVLRYHSALPYYWHDGRYLGDFPAMVAPLVAPDGRLVALHRTYLTHDGRKADVPTPKKLTSPSGPINGACIPLYARPRRGCMGVAEGIETALAAFLTSGVPTVAAYSTAGMKSWQWPPGLQRLVIFADADANGAGEAAAQDLRERALAAQLTVNLILPTTPGTDWADVWVKHARAQRRE